VITLLCRAVSGFPAWRWPAIPTMLFHNRDTRHESHDAHELFENLTAKMSHRSKDHLPKTFWRMYRGGIATVFGSADTGRNCRDRRLSRV
jgi:hypothetical protein